MHSISGVIRTQSRDAPKSICRQEALRRESTTPLHCRSCGHTATGITMQFPIRRVGQESFCLPVGDQLTDEQVAYVIDLSASSTPDQAPRRLIASRDDVGRTRWGLG